MAIHVLASLSESWREAPDDVGFQIIGFLFIYFVGPFWILFLGGNDSLLGAAWLAADIIAIRTLFLLTSRWLKQRDWWRVYGEHLWGCLIMPLPVVVWIVLNGVSMLAWSYLNRS